MRFSSPRRDSSFVALAGPVSNLILGIIFCAIYLGLAYRFVGTGWFILVKAFIQINFGLAIFNLLPLYPLDGSKVMQLLLSRPAADKYESVLERAGVWPLLFLLMVELVGNGPLHWWFSLWNPILRPILRVFGVPSFW